MDGSFNFCAGDTTTTPKQTLHHGILCCWLTGTLLFHTFLSLGRFDCRAQSRLYLQLSCPFSIKAPATQGTSSMEDRELRGEKKFEGCSCSEHRGFGDPCECARQVTRFRQSIGKDGCAGVGLRAKQQIKEL